MNKKSQLRSKNIADMSINASHLSPYAIESVLDYKKIGNARIISRLIEDEGLESGLESGIESGNEFLVSGIEVEVGQREIDITEFINDNSFLASLSLNGVRAGVLSSGQGAILDISIPPYQFKKNLKGETLYDGIPYQQLITSNCGSNIIYKGTITNSPIKQFSFKIYASPVINVYNLVAYDNGKGQIIGAVSPQGIGDEPTNYIDYDTGSFSFKIGTGFASQGIYAIYLLTSFENYKVWIRRSETRLPLNNGQNRNVFAELYAEEYLPITNGLVGSQEGQVTSFAQDNPPEFPTLFANQAIVSSNYPYWNNFVGSILCASNGFNNESDIAIGLVTNFNNSNHTLSLKARSEVNHSGHCKFIRWKLRFWTYNTNWTPIPYFFPSNANIDILFLEASSLLDEDQQNIYNFNNFFKSVDLPVPTFEVKPEEQMTEAKITDASQPSNISGVIYPTGVPMHIVEPPPFGTNVNFVEFEVDNDFYLTGSLEVFIDGVRIMHLQPSDDGTDRRIIEQNNSIGTFRIINFQISDLTTEQVFVSYLGG